MNLADALRRSCDTYFYELFFQQWQREQAGAGADDEVLPDVARAFGHGRSWGSTCRESTGVIPGREWKQQYWEQTRSETNCELAQEQPDGSYAQRLYTELCESGNVWRGGDAVNTSIGQGDVLATPMQVAAAYMAIANGGTVYAAAGRRRVLDPDGEVARDRAGGAERARPRRAGAQPASARPRRGRDARARHRLRGLPGLPARGDPGGRQDGHRRDAAARALRLVRRLRPGRRPEVVVVVNIEEGGGGSQTAAPIARNILEAYFGLNDVEDVEFEVGPEFND
jgi:penicillin-binding protein 2